MWLSCTWYHTLRRIIHDPVDLSLRIIFCIYLDWKMLISLVRSCERYSKLLQPDILINLLILPLYLVLYKINNVLRWNDKIKLLVSCVITRSLHMLYICYPSHMGTYIRFLLIIKIWNVSATVRCVNIYEYNITQAHQSHILPYIMCVLLMRKCVYSKIQEYPTWCTMWYTGPITEQMCIY